VTFCGNDIPRKNHVTVVGLLVILSFSRNINSIQNNKCGVSGDGEENKNYNRIQTGRDADGDGDGDNV